MRKIREMDLYDVDVQHALYAVNEGLEELGIDEKDIISVQHEEVDPPIRMHPGNREGRSLIRVFYWA